MVHPNRPAAGATIRTIRARLALIGLALAGSLVAAPGVHASAAQIPCERTFSSGPVNAAITSPSLHNYPIDVPEDGLVPTDIDVQVNIHHTWDSDLALGLIAFTDAGSPRGSVLLSDDNGGSGDNMLGTVFDDSAATLISAGSPPFTGRFRPEMPLSGLNGLPGGRWELQVADSVNSDDGVLNDWSITFRYASCDLDQDGVEDHADSCLGVTGPTTNGCPVATRALSAKYRHGKFKGSLSSSVPACNPGRSVTIWKVRKGPDRKVLAATTGSDGSYKKAHAKRAGRYYATSAAVYVAGVANCPSVQSPRFRIR